MLRITNLINDKVLKFYNMSTFISKQMTFVNSLILFDHFPNNLTKLKHNRNGNFEDFFKFKLFVF